MRHVPPRILLPGDWGQLLCDMQTLRAREIPNWFRGHQLPKLYQWDIPGAQGTVRLRRVPPRQVFPGGRGRVIKDLCTLHTGDLPAVQGQQCVSGVPSRDKWHTLRPNQHKRVRGSQMPPRDIQARPNQRHLMRGVSDRGLQPWHRRNKMHPVQRRDIQSPDIPKGSQSMQGLSTRSLPDADGSE